MADNKIDELIRRKREDAEAARLIDSIEIDDGRSAEGEILVDTANDHFEKNIPKLLEGFEKIENPIPDLSNLEGKGNKPLDESLDRAFDDMRTRNRLGKK